MKLNRIPKQAIYQLYKNPSINNYLDISTCHITEKDNQLLTQAAKGDSDNPVVTYDYEYGYFVYVPTNDPIYNALIPYGYSKQFIKILKRACILHCGFVLFDGNGTEYNDLESFSW
jgi:hypothetical protein